MYTASDHTWVICAYGESPYLETCIQSLTAQTVRTNILMITSTPGDYLTRISEKHAIPLTVNHGEAGISGDWNFGLSQATTALVTLAHQDDIYEPAYVEEMLKSLNRARRPILYFSDYGELRDGRKVQNNRLLKIKRLMLIPLRVFPGRKWARRLSLSCGNPICCPAITYLSDIMRARPFTNRFKSNLDWEQTERLSRLRGSFVFNRRVLMYHRIHEGSTTSALIEQHERSREDYEMMRRFWPDGIARRLSRLYASSEKSNSSGL